MSFSQGRSQGYANVGERFQRGLDDRLDIWDGEKWRGLGVMYRDVFFTKSMSSDYVMTDDEADSSVLVLSDISANRILTLPFNSTTLLGAKSYTLMLTPQATSGGPFTLTLKTAVAATDTVVIPIILSTDTLLSGTLATKVTVDTSGNVACEAWSILASNTTGEYSMLSSGSLVTDAVALVNTAISVAAGAIFFTNAALGLGAPPRTFSGSPTYLVTPRSFSYATTWISAVGSGNATTHPTLYLMSSASRAAADYSFSVVGHGKWK